jgi:hypothetical protein
MSFQENTKKTPEDVLALFFKKLFHNYMLRYIVREFYVKHYSYKILKKEMDDSILIQDWY